MLFQKVQLFIYLRAETYVKGHLVHTSDQNKGNLKQCLTSGCCLSYCYGSPGTGIRSPTPSAGLLSHL